MSDLPAYKQYLQGILTTPRVVVVDGNNILFAPDAAAEKGNKIPLSEIIQAIVAFLQTDLPNCPLTVDIVFKNLPHYDPEDYLLALKQETALPVIVSYTDLMDWRQLGTRFREFDDFLTLKKVVAYSELLGPENVILLSCDGYANSNQTLTTMGRAQARLIERNYLLPGQIAEYLHHPNLPAANVLNSRLAEFLPKIHRLTNQSILESLGFPREQCSRFVRDEIKLDCTKEG